MNAPWCSPAARSWALNRNKFYATCAIDYVNAQPHLGHALEKVGADALVRYHRMLGKRVWLVLGSDEHSQSVEHAARDQGLTPQAFTDRMAEVFTTTWDRFQVTCSSYVRTNSRENQMATEEFLKRLSAGGHIYKGTYSGWYCGSCEQFYPEAELLEGNCPEHRSPVQWVDEENYFFRLSSFRAALTELLAVPGFLQPESRRHEMVNALREGLPDVSISRASTTWGFPLVFDPTQVVYVWFDALLSYVSGAGFPHHMELFDELWPCDVHVIGKGITRFHSLMWPAMLMAAKLPLPARVFAHGYVNIGGEKMSKSRGLWFDPVRLVDIFGSDGARYLILREFAFDRDSDFSLEALIDRFNADLANNFGNLVSRCLRMLRLYRPQGVPARSDWGDLGAAVSATLNAFPTHMEELDFSAALADVWHLVDQANRHIDRIQPWALAKDEHQAGELDAVLYRLIEVCRLLAVLVAPAMPAISARLLQALASSPDGSWEEQVRWGGVAPGLMVEEIGALFPRLEKDKILGEVG